MSTTNRPMNLDEIKWIIEQEAAAIKNIPVNDKYGKAVDIIVFFLFV